LRLLPQPRPSLKHLFGSPREIWNPPNHDDHTSCIFDTSAVSRPQNLSHLFTHKMHAFTKRRDTSYTHSNKKTKTPNHAECLPSTLPYLHLSSPAHYSPYPSSPSLHPPPKAAPPPSHALATKPEAAACLQSAVRGSAQSGTPVIRTRKCALSHTRDPLYHQTSKRANHGWSETTRFSLNNNATKIWVWVGRLSS